MQTFGPSDEFIWLCFVCSSPTRASVAENGALGAQKGRARAILEPARGPMQGCGYRGVGLGAKKGLGDLGVCWRTPLPVVALFCCCFFVLWSVLLDQERLGEPLKKVFLGPSNWITEVGSSILGMGHFAQHGAANMRRCVFVCFTHIAQRLVDDIGSQTKHARCWGQVSVGHPHGQVGVNTDPSRLLVTHVGFWLYAEPGPIFDAATQ